MTPPTELENVTVAMCARIDELSTNLVLHGCAGVRVEDLDAVAVDAEQSGCPEAARVATSLAAHMRVKLLNEGELQPALCAGLTEMKRLLEQHHEAGERPSDVVAFSTTKATAATSFSEDAELTRSEHRKIDALVTHLLSGHAGKPCPAGDRPIISGPKRTESFRNNPAA